ncbi:transcription antitermination factor NusB [Nocardioides sp. Iso805N]|uniref:transcription antitermination factor NusB n=1 Tax=Nocardioides sp. Iso805N TaxID=1283287 RepID=UPI0003715065|nr:transcription antitermination factor NusB [Nocardioides sp. Iso805N]
MSARSKARKRALDLLFAAEAQGTSATDLLAAQVADGELNNPYTATLVEGVVAKQAAIDEILGRYAQGWTLDRMPAVDRNVLRLGAWELLFADDVPEHVALSEAVELVRDLSTDESPTYVNGVLGAIQRDKASLA